MVRPPRYSFHTRCEHQYNFRWEFTQKHNVKLPDEYDQINRDLEPFWALEPADMAHRNKVMQERGHTFSLIVQNGIVSIEGPFKHIRRAKDIADIISKFSEDLPRDLNMYVFQYNA